MICHENAQKISKSHNITGVKCVFYDYFFRSTYTSISNYTTLDRRFCAIQ